MTTPRRITRDEIDAALQHDQFRRRTEAMNKLATAALAGVPPDDLYAEALVLGLIPRPRNSDP